MYSKLLLRGVQQKLYTVNPGSGFLALPAVDEEGLRNQRQARLNDAVGQGLQPLTGLYL